MSQRILEAVGAVAGSSLEQTSWLSRNLEVKAQPQVCPQGDEDDHDANEFEGKPMQKKPIAVLPTYEMNNAYLYNLLRN